MGEKDNRYTDIAENDYLYLKEIMESGKVANMLAADIQNTCEKYLKGAIEDAGLENKCLTGEMKAHSLRKLHSFLKTNAPDVLKSVHADRSKIINADGYYFYTRYPGDDYYQVSKEDIEKSWEGLCECRKIALAAREGIKNKTDVSVSHPETQAAFGQEEDQFLDIE